MRMIIVISLVFCFAAQGLHAANAAAVAAAAVPELTPEEKALAEFTKGMNNPEKSARVAAITAFEATKPPPSAWPLLGRAATGDPEHDVKLAAVKALVKLPAHDPRVAKMVVAAFEDVKVSDMKTKIAIAKAVEPIEFQSDVLAALVDQIEKMRWPEEPRAYKGRQVSQKYKDEVKEKRTEFTEMMAAFNTIAKSDVAKEDKETPAKVRKWWEANQAKFIKIDSDLIAKYAKADAESQKAAKDAAKK